MSIINILSRHGQIKDKFFILMKLIYHDKLSSILFDPISLYVRSTRTCTEWIYPLLM